MTRRQASDCQRRRTPDPRGAPLVAEPAISGPQSEPATVRVAMWSSRHRWPVAAAWFLATIGLFVVSQALGGIRADNPNGSPNDVQTESAKAATVFDAGGSGTPSENVTIVVTHRSLRITDSAFRTFVAQGVRQLTALRVSQAGASVPAFAQVEDPTRASPKAGLVAPDGSAVRIVGRLTATKSPSSTIWFPSARPSRRWRPTPAASSSIR